MISGITATVIAPGEPAYDRFNNAVPGAPTETEVANVVVAPGSAAELDQTRPEGVRVALTLHFPKEWTGSLRGCSVRLGAPYEGTYRVIGDPQPYMDGMTPTDWHMPVEVEAVDG